MTQKNDQMVNRNIFYGERERTDKRKSRGGEIEGAIQTNWAENQKLKAL